MSEKPPQMRVKRSRVFMIYFFRLFALTLLAFAATFSVLGVWEAMVNHVWGLLAVFALVLYESTKQLFRIMFA